MSKKGFQPKYRVFSNNTNLVRVGCSYAGKKYYGTAICSPEDEFDFDFGVRLAKLRCDRTIYYEKVKRSQEKLKTYTFYSEYFKKCMEDEQKYLDMQKNAALEAEVELDKLLNGVEDCV